jgi:hypothetical protein
MLSVKSCAVARGRLSSSPYLLSCFCVIALVELAMLLYS